MGSVSDCYFNYNSGSKTKEVLSSLCVKLISYKFHFTSCLYKNVLYWG